MRSVEDILRTFNIVNSRSSTRYTMRFAAILVLAGAGVLVVALALTGGPDGTAGPEALQRDAGEDGADGADGMDVDPLEIVTRPVADGTYIGYAPERYDPALADDYAADDVHAAVLAWLADRSPGSDQPDLVPVYAPDDGTLLLGYTLRG